MPIIIQIVQSSVAVALVLIGMSACFSIIGSPPLEGPHISNDAFLKLGEGSDVLKFVSPKEAIILPKSVPSILIIYSHGSLTDDLAERNCNYLNRLIPLKPLLEAPIHGARVWIYVKCTNDIAGDLNNPEERDFSESYLCILENRKNCLPKKYKEYKRREEILRTIRSFRDQGFTANRIFLMGHSCGGWQSMMLASQYPALIAGVIAIDPGCYGTAKWQAMRPNYSRLRQMEINMMRQASNWHGLVFTNSDSPCCNPATLDWLASMQNVTRIVTPAKVNGQFIVDGRVCHIAGINGQKIRPVSNGHQLNYSPCFSAYIPLIREFMQTRTK